MQFFLIIVIIACVALIVFLLIKNKKNSTESPEVLDEPAKEDADDFDLSHAEPLHYDPDQTVSIVNGVPQEPTLYLSDAQADTTYYTPLKSVMTVGRKTGVNDICIQNGTISGQHCELFLVNEDLFLRDLGSSNGSFIIRNGKTIKVDDPHGVPIYVDDYLLFGNVKLLPWIR